MALSRNIFIFGICIAISIILLISTFVDNSSASFLSFNLNGIWEKVAKVSALLIMYFYGSLRKNDLLKSIFFVGIGMGCLGLLFKLEHLPGASILILSASAICLVVYIFHFIKKTKKNILDFLKLVWVLLALIGIILTMERLPFGNTAIYASHYIFLALFAYFTFTLLKPKETIQKPTFDFDNNETS